MLLDSIKCTLFALWGIFLFWLLTAGKNDLIHLLHPRLWWIIGAAAIVQTIFLLATLTSHSHHHHDKTFLFELPGLLIMLIPLIYFTLAKDVRLDDKTLENRTMHNQNGIVLNTVPSTTASGSAQAMASGSPTEIPLSKIYRELDQLTGKNVEVVCKSYEHDSLPKNTVMCYRFLITCCVADALPIFVLLDHPDSLKIENNRWIKTRGMLSTLEHEGQTVPSITIDEVEYVEEPTFPWVL